MCWELAAGLQDAGGHMPQEHLRRMLAAAVRSVQWSYAIFWGTSIEDQQGVLEWKEGYYNGEIKTRKTIQNVELNADEILLQRSQQLRELFSTLSADDSSRLEARRPPVSLSPEDLTDLEWYYLVCMSFTFDYGQGLPGNELANGHHIWLYNAHLADSKIFSRSLLAKSASIQTVVCFPLLSGILEIGVTELISETTNLIQCIKTAFHESPVTLCDKGNHYNSDVENTKEHNLISNDTEQNVTKSTYSISDDPNCLEPHSFNNGSLVLDCMNMNSPIQTWQFMEGDCSDDILSDGMCQPFGNANHSAPQELQECNYSKLNPVNLPVTDPHYFRTLESIFGIYQEPIKGASLIIPSSISNFWPWTKGIDASKFQSSSSQKTLKYVISGAIFHSIWFKSSRDEIDEIGKELQFDTSDCAPYHVLSERQRREKINEKFSILRALVPAVSKIDKLSILGDTIEYLKTLERRVEELEASKEQEGSHKREKEVHPDIVERTSDNYYYDVPPYGKQSDLLRKRNEAVEELNWVWFKDGSADVTVTIVGREVMVNIKCPWRECLLMEVLEAINKLQLDVHTVQSCTANGRLTLTLKSKFKGAAVLASGMIKEVLGRVLVLHF